MDWYTKGVRFQSGWQIWQGNRWDEKDMTGVDKNEEEKLNLTRNVFYMFLYVLCFKYVYHVEKKLKVYIKDKDRIT